MSTTNILDLNNRIDALEKAVSGGDSAQANKKDIATEFNTTTNYTAGGFVYYKGKLYQFNADHAAGAWDPTDVVEANVTDQIVSNKAAIDGLTASDVAYNNTVSGLTATDVQGAVDELASGKSTVMVKDVTVTLTSDSTGSTRRIDTGVTPNKILSVYPIYTDDLYYVMKIDEIGGFIYSVDTTGFIVIVAPPGKDWGGVTAQRTLTFKVAYLL